MRKVKNFAAFIVQVLSFGAFICFMFALAAIFGACSMQRQSASAGKATIITTDTTYIYHGGTVKFPKTK